MEYIGAFNYYNYKNYRCFDDNNMLCTDIMRKKREISSPCAVHLYHRLTTGTGSRIQEKSTKNIKKTNMK